MSQVSHVAQRANVYNLRGSWRRAEPTLQAQTSASNGSSPWRPCRGGWRESCAACGPSQWSTLGRSCHSLGNTCDNTYIVKDNLHLSACFIRALYLFCDLLGFRGRPSLDTLRGIAAVKSEGGALIRVPPAPAARV